MPDPFDTDPTADAARLIRKTRARSPMDGEAIAVAAQARRAFDHCVMTDLTEGTDLFHVEPDAYGAAIARLARSKGAAR